MRPSLRRALAALAATTFVFAACGDDNDTTAESSTTTPSDTPTSIDAESDGPDEATTTTGDVAPAAGTVIEIEVAGGEVTGSGRQKVDLGESVTIRVTSDVDDHIHLHGYDVLTDVRAGTPAELTFDATIPGVFEVELEDSGVLLVELEVS